MQSRVSTLLQAILEDREPILEKRYPYFTLTYPGTNALFEWKVEEGDRGRSVIEWARQYHGLAFPLFTTIKILTWYAGNSEGMTLTLVTNFLDAIEQYGSVIVRATIVNQKLRKTFETLGGETVGGESYLYIKNGRPQPFPEEWRIQEEPDESASDILQQVSERLAT